MTTAPAPLPRPRPAAPPRRAPAPLRVVRPVDALDLDAAMADALAPHAAPSATAGVAPVVDLDEHRRRGTARVRRHRRRAVVVALVLATVLAVAVGAGARATGSGASPAPVGPTVTVEPGQTLWDVAATVTPAGGDVRGTVAEIRRLNDLGGGPVPAWTPVVLPAD